MNHADNQLAPDVIASLPRPVILVAEDDEDFRDYVCSQLARDACSVLPVCDGATAMTYIDLALMEPAIGLFPNLIVTDIRMPGCDGFALLAYARFIPTIAMTAFGDAATRATARELGACYFFDKPFDVDALKTAAKELVDAGRE